MKPILVVRLYVIAKYRRNFEKLVDRVKEAGGNVVLSDFESVPKMNLEALTVPTVAWY